MSCARITRYSLLLVMTLVSARTGWSQIEDSIPVQTDPDATNDSFFDSVTITATGSERDTFEVATPVTVIDTTQIQREQPENAADLLRDQPGVDVNGVGPNQARPVIRGLRGLRVLLLEDGLRLNNARRQTDFGELPGLVDLESVSTVEVVRGPASVLYGSDAIGGVLNLIPRSLTLPADRRVAGQIRLGYASGTERRSVGFDLGGRFGKFDFQVGASDRASDDYKAPRGRFGRVALNSETLVRDSGVEDNSAWVNFGWQLGDHHELRLRHQRVEADQAGFGFVDPETIGDDSGATVRILYPFQDFDRTVLSYAARNLGWGFVDRLEAKMYSMSNERALVNDIDINIGPIAPGFPDSSVEADTRNLTDLDTVGLRLEANKVLRGKDLLTYGAELFEDDSINTDFSKTTTTIRFPFPPFEDREVTTDDIANTPNATNRSWGLFVQDEVVVTKRFRVTGGARHQEVTTRAEPTRGWDISRLDFSDSATVGSVTASYELTPQLNGFISYGRAFRAPNIVERLFNGVTPEGIGFQVLNADLESEKSRNWDLGLKYRRKNAIFELSAFRNDIKGGIVQETLSEEECNALPAETRAQIDEAGGCDALEVVQQRNADELRYEGYEVVLGYRCDCGVTVGGNYTFLRAEAVGSINRPAGDTYGSKAVAYARYQPTGRRYWIEYRVRHNGENELGLDPDATVPPIGRTLPAFTVHTLSGGLVLYESGPVRQLLDLRVENLTNELYSEFSNASFFRPEPGRNVKVGVRLSF